jgi:hypothetical protein
VTRNWGASLTPGWSRKRRLSHCSLDQSPGQYVLDSIDSCKPMCYMERLNGRVLLLKGGKS